MGRPALTSAQAGERLTRETPEILRRWEARVRAEVPAARYQDSPLLRHLLPEALGRLAEALRKGQPPGPESGLQLAREHAEQRANVAAYTLEQVLQECQLVRRVALEVLEAEGPLDPAAGALLDRHIDQVVRKIAAHYEEASQRALRMAEEEHEFLVEGMREHAVIRLDLEGRIVTWSPGAERITGWTAAEATGQPVAMLFTREDRQGGTPEAEMRQARNEGRAEDERWQLCSDGSLYFASGVLIALRRKEQLHGFTKIFRDATRRRRAEEERDRLLYQERVARLDAEQGADRLRRLQAVTDVVIAHRSLDDLLHDLLRRIREALSVDTAAVLLRREEVLEVCATIGLEEEVERGIRIPVGRGFAGRIAAERRPLAVENLDDVEVVSLVLREKGVCSLMGVPLVSRQDEVLGVLHVGTVTGRRFYGDDRRLLELVADRAVLAIERARLTEELERRATELAQADRRKDEFLATLAHELRNPLASIANAAYLLDQIPVDDPDRPRLRGVISRQTDHLSRMVDDLLDLSRITHQKIELRRTEVDLRAVLRGAVETTRTFVEARGHELIQQLPVDPVPVTGDAMRLEQVVTNLLTNAARYTDPGGKIWLSLAVESRELRVENPDSGSAGPPTLNPQLSTAVISIRDTGRGIPTELLPGIFDLFTQAERDPDRGEGGLGIGLTLVHRLVALHGGTVAARSDGPGHGSEFTVNLPIADCGMRIADLSLESEKSVPPNPQSAIGVPAPAGHPQSQRALLVEDNADAAETLAEVLDLWGKEVQIVGSGAAAVDAALQFRPDVVLLDIGLPEVDGYEVARRLRACDALRGLLLIALTGYGREEDRRRAAAAGFDHHLTKPVDLARLREMLAERMKPEG